MRLLEDVPAVDLEEPHRRPRTAIWVAVGVLVTMAVVGALLLTSATDAERDGTRDLTGAAGESDATLDEWVAGASQACQAVAAEHPTFRTGSGASPEEMDLAVRALTGPIRDLPMPGDREERVRVIEVVTMGDQAEQAWYGLGTRHSNEIPPDELRRATGLAEEFVTGLSALGADCAALH